MVGPDLVRGRAEGAPPTFKSYQYRSWYPGNAIEEAQEPEWGSLPPGLVEYLRTPLDPGVDVKSKFYNGNVCSFFPLTVGTVSPVMALIENKRRTYLLIQNLGPGNLAVQFGQAAAVNLTLMLVSKQVYEPNPAGLAGTLCPPRNSVWVIADAAATQLVVAEGTWSPV